MKQLIYPNGETSAMADAGATSMSLKLGFKVNLTNEDSEGEDSTKLVLDISRLEIEMGAMSIEIDENPMAWLINPTIIMLNPLLRILICNQLKGMLAEPMKGLCATLNALLDNAKPMLAKIGWPPKGLKHKDGHNIVPGDPANISILLALD